MANITFTIYNDPYNKNTYTCPEDISWQVWETQHQGTDTTWHYENNLLSCKVNFRAYFINLPPTSIGPIDLAKYTALSAVTGLTVIGSGGGGTGSDDCTGTRDCVLECIPGTSSACTAITKDSDDEVVQGTIKIKGYTQDEETGAIIIPERNYFHTETRIDASGEHAGVIQNPVIVIKSDKAKHEATVDSSCKIIRAGLLLKQTKNAAQQIITASDLASGDKELEDGDKQDIIGYASVTVKKGKSGEVILAKSDAEKAKSNHTITVTGSAKGTKGYIQDNTQTKTTTVSASELVSGTATITSKDAMDVTNFANAQIDATGLEAGNILAGVTILGVEGSIKTFTW